MDYSVLLPFIMQFLLAMGLANDHDRQSQGRQFLRLKYSIDMRTPENIIGATFFTENRLLVYSANMLVIIDLSNTSQTQYKYLQDFQPRKIVKGFDTELLLLSTGKDCIRYLNVTTRDLNTFSGNCEQSGFVDGDRLTARYNNPTDLQKNGDYFYVADYNNDCIRRLWGNGYVSKLISIHSRPFELGGDLYVAAHQNVYKGYRQSSSLLKVRGRYNTYVRFIDEVNITSLESCSLHALSMLSMDKCLNLIPLSRDLSLHPATIDGSFDGLICDNNVTYVTQLTSSEQHSSTMQIYAVDTEAAIGIRPLSVPSSTTEPTTTRPDSTTSRQTSTFKEPKRTESTHSATQTTSATSNRTSTTNELMTSQTSSSNTDFTTLLNKLDSSNERRPIIPLSNHAHDSFSHLPSSYTQSNGSMTVILPVVLAVITVVVVLIALACIIYKRSSRQVLEVEPEDNSIDQVNLLLLADHTSPLRHSNSNNNGIHNGHHYPNGNSTNGRIIQSLSNGHTVKSLSYGNGMTVSEPSHGLPTRCHSAVTDLTQL